MIHARSGPDSKCKIETGPKNGRAKAPSPTTAKPLRTAGEPAFHGVADYLAVYVCQRFGERNSLWAYLYAILGVVAVFDSARAHESFKSLVGVHRACRMHVKKTDLADDRSAYEIGMFVYLRADLQAIAAGDAAGERVAFFLQGWRHARTFAQRIGAVDRDPAMRALQAFEHG